MKNNKIPWIYIVPVIGIYIAVGIATAVKYLYIPNSVSKDVVKEYPNPYTDADSKRPTTFLGKLSDGKTSATPTVTPTMKSEIKTTTPSVARAQTMTPMPTQSQLGVTVTSSLVDVNSALKDTINDGGVASLNTLEQEINEL